MSAFERRISSAIECTLNRPWTPSLCIYSTRNLTHSKKRSRTQERTDRVVSLLLKFNLLLLLVLLKMHLWDAIYNFIDYMSFKFIEVLVQLCLWAQRSYIWYFHVRSRTSLPSITSRTISDSISWYVPSRYFHIVHMHLEKGKDHWKHVRAHRNRRDGSSFPTTICQYRYFYDILILDFLQGTSLQDHNWTQE